MRLEQRPFALLQLLTLAGLAFRIFERKLNLNQFAARVPSWPSQSA